MKINIKKSALSILCASCVLVTNNAYANLETKNDYIEAKTKVNIRFSESTKSIKMGELENKSVAYRILSSNNWDLIRYNDKIGYVCHDYVNDKEETLITDTYTEVNDILYTTSKVNFRLGPSLEDKRICTIKKDTEIFPIALVNNWYLVKYNGQIGYVCADYVRSFKEEIKENYNIENITIKKIVYANEKAFMYDNYNNICGFIEQYEGAYLIDNIDNKSLIKTDKYFGYIENKYLKEVEGKLIEIDLTDQYVTLYCENDVVLRSDIVTGKNTTPTRIGNFKIYAKERDRYLRGADYNTHVDFWMPFDGGIGLHDATWRDNFGGEIYIKNGSHGCVNLPYEIAQFIYKNVKVGTKVLVHK